MGLHFASMITYTLREDKSDNRISDRFTFRHSLHFTSTITYML
jgi:hypothetical protein